MESFEFLELTRKTMSIKTITNALVYYYLVFFLLPPSPPLPRLRKKMYLASRLSERELLLIVAIVHCREGAKEGILRRTKRMRV